VIFTADSTLNFFGAYIEAGWLLTGETHPYLLDKGVFGQVIPKAYFSNRQGSPGAIELAMRCSYLNLNDRSIDGGRMTVTTGGLNWYLTRHTMLRISTGVSKINGGETPGTAIITQTQFSILF
jgi:phosphate-selective porin OprO/OprP